MSAPSHFHHKLEDTTMGEARRRGTFEERRKQAIARGRVKWMKELGEKRQKEVKRDMGRAQYNRSIMAQVFQRLFGFRVKTK